MLSCIAKIFGAIIHKVIFFKVKHHIITEQHGFYSGRSVESNLLLYANTIAQALDNGMQIDSIYTDFSKAFDKIDHNILVAKLLSLGINGDLLRWIMSYISNRSQIVNVNGFMSSSALLTSGIAQGSHLGPLFFIIYINDIKSCFRHSNFLMYADDLKLFSTITSPIDCLNVQHDLTRLLKYCNDNKLYLNYEKCLHITFTRKKTNILFPYSFETKTIKQVKEIKDLGVLFDSKLLFESHIEAMCNKAYKMLGYIIRSSKSFRNIASLKILYYAYVYSILNYCSIIWNPQYATYIDRIERIQRKFIKHLEYKYFLVTENYTEACREIELFTLTERRVMVDAFYLYKIIHDVVNCPETISLLNFNVPNYNTRSTSTFMVPKYNTNCMNNSVIPRLMLAYNNLSNEIDIFAHSISNFKNLIKDLIKNKNES